MWLVASEPVSLRIYQPGSQFLWTTDKIGSIFSYLKSEITWQTATTGGASNAVPAAREHPTNQGLFLKSVSRLQKVLNK